MLKINLVICALALLFIFTAFVDAKWIRRNDYFDPGCIIKSCLGFLDFVSDVLFAVQLLMLCIDDEPDDNGLMLNVLTIAAFSFIMIPMAFSFHQLFIENKREWIRSVQLRNGMKSKSYIIYMLSVLSGSAQSAVALVNSDAFKLQMFSMGLTKRQRLAFDTHRIWSVVVCEVEFCGKMVVKSSIFLEDSANLEKFELKCDRFFRFWLKC